jgi:twinkle protein
MDDDSTFTHHEACPSCNSSDALAMYTDGHGHCFSCSHYQHADDSAPTPKEPTMKSPVRLLEGLSVDRLAKRGITLETCKKFGYSTGSMTHPDTQQPAPCQVAQYHDERGQVVAQKIRFADKTMRFLGGSKTAPLFGQHLWKAGGKRLVITEGEIDAMSVSQAFGNKWAVVSIPNGASAAAASVAHHIKYINAFDKVVFCFDTDAPGVEAAEECCQLLPPGKAFTVSLSEKDANAMTQAGKATELREAIMFNAKEYRPDGVLRMADLLEEVKKPTEQGDPWPWDALTKLTFGRRLGEVIGLGAGTGIGKTDVLTQMISFITTKLKKPCGVFFLEQSPVETVKRIAGKTAGKKFHLPDDSWKMDDLIATTDAMGKSDLLHMYDNFGATDWDVISTTIRYLAVSCGVQDFFLDHLTALAAAEEDERKSLEKIMAAMAMLAKELNVRILFVSHLATPESKPHEEGGRVMIRHFKGSRSIGFWSHFMLGLERNCQAEDEEERRTTTVRVLKDRYTGQSTGHTMNLLFDPATGILNYKANDAAVGFTAIPATPSEDHGDF